MTTSTGSQSGWTLALGCTDGPVAPPAPSFIQLLSTDRCAQAPIRARTRVNPASARYPEAEPPTTHPGHGLGTDRPKTSSRVATTDVAGPLLGRDVCPRLEHWAAGGSRAAGRPVATGC